MRRRHTPRRLWILPASALAGMLLFARPRQAQAGAPHRKNLGIYVVQPGDSCWSIAKRLFGDGRKYTIIHKYNDLGPLPHLLKPGQKLRLPRRIGGPMGRLVWLHRDVRSRAPRDVAWKKARRNQGLWKLYRVATGTASSAQIRFADESSLRMRPEAILVIYGGASRRTRTTGQVKTRVLLERGTLRGGLSRMDREAGLVVETPSSTVTIRSKSSQVQVDRLKTSIVSVYQGLASVLAQGTRVLVPKGHGTWTKMGRRPAKPVALPNPPRWQSPSSPKVVRLMLPGTWGTFDARWRAAARAAKYHVELAEDLKFTRIVVDATVGAGVRRFSARDLRPGTYYAHVATIDSHGLESAPSRPIQVTVVRLGTSRRLEPDRKGILQTVGVLGLSPPLASKTGPLEVSLDGRPFEPWNHQIIVAGPGLHKLTYRPQGRRESATLSVRILNVAAGFALPKEPIRPSAGPASIHVRLRDELGRAAALPGLALQSPAGRIALQPEGPGLYRAQLQIPRTWHRHRYPLQLKWALGTLARTSLPVVVETQQPRQATPQPPKPPQRFSWPHRPVGLIWSHRAPGHLGEAARPVSHIELGVAVADGLPKPAGRDTYLVSTLAGGLSLLSGRLGLEAGLPWFDGTINRDDQTGRQDLGDLRVAIMGVAWQGLGLAVSPVVSTTLPTGSPNGWDAVSRIEPGLRLDWTYEGRLTLGTNQVLSVAVAPGIETSGTYASSYHGVWQPLSRLSFALELDLWMGLFGDPTGKNIHAVALSGALWLHLGRGRIGFMGGGGLNADAWNRLGRYHLGLTASLGFRGL